MNLKVCPVYTYFITKRETFMEPILKKIALPLALIHEKLQLAELMY